MIMMENQIENNIFHLMEVRNTGKNYHFDKKMKSLSHKFFISSGIVVVG